MKARKSIHPLVKQIKPDATPQVYFTHSLWIIIREKLIREYCAHLAVLRAWFDLTKGEDTAKAGDVLWLANQPPRVRDVAWMIHYKKEWLP